MCMTNRVRVIQQRTSIPQLFTETLQKIAKLTHININTYKYTTTLST